MSTRGYCLFCLESVQSTDNVDTTKTFIKFLQSYAKFDDLGPILQELEFTKISPTYVLDCCEKCQLNVDKFCEIYHKIKCLEIQLELQLDNVVNTIEQTDKWSSKWERSVDLLKSIFNNDEDSKDNCHKLIRKFREHIKIGRHKLTESKQRVLEKSNENVSQSSIMPNVTDQVDTCSNALSDETSSVSMETNDSLDDRSKDSVTPMIGTVPSTQLKLESENITDDDEHLNFSSFSQPSCPENLNDTTKICQPQNLINQSSISLIIENRVCPAGNSSTKTINCIQCGQLCKSKKALERHTIFKHTERTIQCSHCKNKYHTQAELNRHNSFHKKPEEWKWQCKICQKRFPFQQKLNKHLKTHVRASQSNPSEHVQSSNVESLEMSTNQQKPTIPTEILESEGCPGDIDLNCLKCDECGKIFKSKISLKQHKSNPSSHSIRQFPCQHCEKKYHNDVMLKTHMIKCHKSKMSKWQCNKCDKKCISECQFSEHMLTHTTAENPLMNVDTVP